MSALLASRNPEVRALSRDLARLAATELPLVIEGETGTGKSRLGRRLHGTGRRGRPLVIVDCGSLPASLVAAELFGHRSGAFTDASRARQGLLARAGDGTLVLDHLEALAGEGQTALLRVLEERRFSPVGAATARPFRARVVALADIGLAGRLEAGDVRRDLYHRLAGNHLVLPPLRERPEDILPTASRLLRSAARNRHTALGFDREAEELLTAYSWPGNFRELEIVVRRAALATDAESIGVADLRLPRPPWPRLAEHAGVRELSLAEVSRLYALWTLGEERGNVSRAARRLGISRRTLIRWRSQA